MNAKQSAANDLKALGLRFKGIIALADELDRIGSLEQAETEIKGRVSVAQVEEGKAKVRLDGLNAQAQKAEAGIKKANEQSTLIITDAQTAATQILAAAKVASGQMDADARSRKANVDTAIRMAESELLKMEQQYTARSKELASLLAKIEQVKDSARKALA